MTLETWTAVNIGARPKILIVDFYWNDSGTIKFYFESSYCEGLVGTYHDYIRVTDNGFEYITKEAVVSQAKLVYTAIY